MEIARKPMKKEISEMIDGSLDAVVTVRELMPGIEQAAKIMIEALKKGNKILKESKIKYIEANTLEDAANKAVKALGN